MIKTIPVSVGIFAHNEEKNIAKVINSVLKQKTEVAKIEEIIIISSGSHDRTNGIIRKFGKLDPRIIFVDQLERQGKSSAINLYLRKSHSEVLIIASSDIRLHSHAIEEMTLPFLHSNVGIVGAHPIPTNTHLSQVGREVAVMWQLHHLISLEHPKCGEMVAFRKVIRSIPKESAVDEATIEVFLKIIGYKVAYAPRAIVYNKAPITISEFLTQRRRVFVGHNWVSRKYNYQVSTRNTHHTLHAIMLYLSSRPQDFLPLLTLMWLEFLGRVLGWIDYNILGQNPYIWKMVKR